MRVLIALAVVVLHLAAHVSPFAPQLREALPEDAPAISANRALAPRSGETWKAPLGRAITDPSSAWDPAGAQVGAARWRPVSSAALVVQRAVGGESVLALAASISLLLHVLVALQSARLVEDLRGPPSAAALAGLLVATCPLALPAAAWPARQGVVIAVALGLAGLRLALTGGARRALLGGVSLALAGLSHELAFGLVPAALLLRARGGEDGARGREWRVALPPLLALGARLVVAPPAVVEAFVGVPESAAGALVGVAGLLLPGRLRFAAYSAPAGGPEYAVPGAVALGLLLAAAGLLWRARQRPLARVALALLLGLAPILLAGAYGGAAYQDAYAYAVLPLFAVSVALGLVAAARRGRGLRVAAAVAGALLLGAYVSGTLLRAPAFRSRDGLVRLAAREMPDSPVVRAWQVGLGIVRAESTSGRGDALAALEPQVRDLVALYSADSGEPPLRRDPVAAATGGAVLGRYALAVSMARVDADHPASWTAENAAETTTALMPDWAGSWSFLSTVRQRLGATAGAYEAAARADDIDPGRPGLALSAATLALALGDPRAAIGHLDRLAAIRRAAGAAPLAQAKLLRARVLAADAAAQQLTYEFEEAARLLEELSAAGDRSAPVIAATYDVYLRWADHLVSIDKTGMALIAYRKAASLGGEGNEAAEHLSWLQARVDAEVSDAEAAVARAEREAPNTLADALLSLGIAHSRRGEWDLATEIFRKLETHQGGLNAPLRFAVAKHLYASRIPDGLELAEEQFRLVLEEEPRLVEARYRLARVLLQQGRLEEALDHFERAAMEGVAYDWGIDALLLARRIEDVLRDAAPVR
jgi:tetratricopeptide (TPR) repeat protein